MTYRDLDRKVNDLPFKPFRIRMSNASAIDIRHSGSIIIGETNAVVPTESTVDDRGNRIALDWKTISIAHIVEFVDLNERDSGPKRKRA